VLSVDHEEVVDKVANGYRLPLPPRCPKEVFDIMLMCWDSDPERRPHFSAIYELLSKLARESLMVMKPIEV
jgi:hypothetical protein